MGVPKSGGRAATSAPHIALVTTNEFAHVDDDLPPIVAALDALGSRSSIVDWHDDTVDWSAVDLAVVRSVWDYTWHLDAFLGWAGEISRHTCLANPVGVLRWSADKRYLMALGDQGVPIVPTQVIEPDGGVAVALPDTGEVVVKPVVSAGARDTERYETGSPRARAAAMTHVARLHDQGRAVLVQPYLSQLDDEGETGMVFVADAFSHAFRKGPILTPDGVAAEGEYREPDICARIPSTDQHAVADAALEALAAASIGFDRTDLLYARVDLAPGPDGPVLMELELVEPSLFLTVAPGAATTTAAAFTEWAHRARERESP